MPKGVPVTRALLTLSLSLSLSLPLDLSLSLRMQPSIAYEQQVGQQAVCSLQFSQQVVPPPTDTKPSSKRSPPGKAATLDEPLHAR